MTWRLDGHVGCVIDPRPLWDFDDPAGSETRLRETAASTTGAVSSAWLTQVARALGLQERYAEAHALLDQLDTADPEVGTRCLLERGRLLRGAGDPAAALPALQEAVREARETALELLLVDALHMVALCAPAGEGIEAHHRALEAARSARDFAARDLDAAILNDLGLAHADEGDHAAALGAFEEALEARIRIGDVSRIRSARWMVAWSLRHLGHREEALALQKALRTDLAADGEVDPSVEEEIALLGRAVRDPA